MFLHVGFMLTRAMGASGKMERLVYHVNLVTWSRQRWQENQLCLSYAASLPSSYIFCPNDTNDHEAHVERDPVSYLFIYMSYLANAPAHFLQNCSLGWLVLAYISLFQYRSCEFYLVLKTLTNYICARKHVVSLFIDRMRLTKGFCIQDVFIHHIKRFWYLRWAESDTVILGAVEGPRILRKTGNEESRPVLDQKFGFAKPALDISLTFVDISEHM